VVCSNFVVDPGVHSTRLMLPGRVGTQDSLASRISVRAGSSDSRQGYGQVVCRYPEAPPFAVRCGARSVLCQTIVAEIAGRVWDRISHCWAVVMMYEILHQCDNGVLELSASEGLPLALIEYGMANHGTVSTRSPVSALRKSWTTGGWNNCPARIATSACWLTAS